MPQIQPRVLKGFRDYLPETQLPKDRMLRTISDVFESFGFAPLQTPALEYAEILDGKCGEEGDKLLYRFEDQGGRAVALRYDLTVPLARVLAQHGSLETPFKRYQIGPVWRAEKPARGRFREFVQCDADIAGTKSLLADVEVIQVACTVFARLGIEGFRVRLSNRKLLGGLLTKIGVAEGPAGMGVIRTIDKMDKVDEEGIRRMLRDENQLDEAAVDSIFEFVGIGRSGEALDNAAILDQAAAFFGDNELGGQGVAELRELDARLAPAGIADRVALDLSLARGMDYYTGTIVEGVLTDLPGFGSVLGGGRYDELVGVFRGQTIPAVGISVGVDRLLAGLQELELLTGGASPTQVLVTLFDDETVPAALELAKELREAGLRVEMAHEASKLGKQFKFADRKGIPLVLIQGPDEIRDGQVSVKDLRDGTQESIARAGVADSLSAKLAS